MLTRYAHIAAGLVLLSLSACAADTTGDDGDTDEAVADVKAKRIPLGETLSATGKCSTVETRTYQNGEAPPVSESQDLEIEFNLVSADQLALEVANVNGFSANLINTSGIFPSQISLVKGRAMVSILDNSSEETVSVKVTRTHATFTVTFHRYLPRPNNDYWAASIETEWNCTAKY